MGNSKNTDIVIPVNHWQNALKTATDKVISRCDFSDLSEEEKKWDIKEIEKQQFVIFLLFKPMSNDNLELIKNFNIVVGWKNGLISSHQQLLIKKDPLFFHSQENGFYSRIIPFIEFQLLKFVNKHRGLKFGVEERLNLKNKDESLGSLFSDPKKLDEITNKLIVKGFVKINETDETYRWNGYAEPGKKAAKGMQLVALSLVIESYLKDGSNSKAKQCRALCHYFNYPIDQKNFQEGRIEEATKYLRLYTFLNYI